MGSAVSTRPGEIEWEWAKDSQSTEKTLEGTTLDPVTTSQIKPTVPPSTRSLSLPKAVAAAGGVRNWNARDPDTVALVSMVQRMVSTTNTVADALAHVSSADAPPPHHRRSSQPSS